MEKEERKLIYTLYIYAYIHTHIHTHEARNKLYIAIAVLNSVAGCAAIVNNFLCHCPFHIFFVFRQDFSSSKFFI